MLRVTHIVPGSGGGFYCQNCMRDVSLVGALRTLGHDVDVLPLYLPLFADDPDFAAESPVFYGAVNLYLRHRLPVLRRAPRWFERMLDARALLRWAAHRAGSTRAAGLEDLTISMLQGESGSQAHELDTMVEWMRLGDPPQVVHLSNALLLGLAGRVRRDVGAAVVCTLQDEHVWVDAMAEPFRSRVWELMNAAAAEVDAFISVSRWFADFMETRMPAIRGRTQVVYPGLDTAAYDASALPMSPPVIGYLSRMAESLGLGTLVDAFIALRRGPGGGAGARLRITGGMTGDDHAYVSGLRRRLERAGLAGDVEFVERFDGDARRRFLADLTLLCVPVPGGEAFGMFIAEAMAAGVPVVQPDEGAFAEVIGLGNGGDLYAPNDAGALAGALRRMLADPERLRRLGAAGRETAQRRLTLACMAEGVGRVYKEVTT